MSGNVFVPFNFAPKATQVLKTGGTTTYTIPANEFGYVSVSANLVSSQGTLSLGSDVVYKSGYMTHISQTSGTNTANTYTANSDSYGFVGCVDNGTNAAPHGTFGFGPSGSLTIPAISALTTSLYGYALRNMNEGKQMNFWVKAGDVLTISGGDMSVVINRYDLPS